MSYETRLNSPTLTNRKFRGDMIKANKILNNKYDQNEVP